MTDDVQQVSGYERVDKYGRPYPVSGFTRRQPRRPLGAKVTYTSMPDVEYGRDNEDNFRGLRVTDTPHHAVQSDDRVRRRRIERTTLDADYLLGRIDRQEWRRRQR